jgi:hypothetical protein
MEVPIIRANFGYMTFIMQAIQGSFGKHYLIALWNLKMKVSTEKLTCLICVSVAGEKVPLFDRQSQGFQVCR